MHVHAREQQQRERGGEGRGGVAHTHTHRERERERESARERERERRKESQGGQEEECMHVQCKRHNRRIVVRSWSENKNAADPACVCGCVACVTLNTRLAPVPAS